jgi:hypothetical protein
VTSATGYSEGFSSRYVTLSSVAPTPLFTSFPFLSAPPLRTSPLVSSLLFRSVQLSRCMVVERSLSSLTAPPCPLSLLIFSRSHTAHPSSLILFLPHLMSTSLKSLSSPFLPPLMSAQTAGASCTTFFLALFFG